MAQSNSQRGLNDGSAIYFLIKPFKVLWTTSILCLSFIGIGTTSLMYFCNKESLSILVRTHEEVRLTSTGLEQHLGYWVFKFFSWLAFDLTQIRRVLQGSPEPGTAMFGVKKFLLQKYESLSLFNDALQVVSFRVGILLAYTLTLLLVVVAAASFDGWMERRVRTVSLGRESATIYHQSKFYRTGAIVLAIMVFLSWPTYLEPVWLVVFSVVFAVLVRMQAKYYKKYI